MKPYVLQEDVTSSTKKARAVCFYNDSFNPLTFTEDTEKEMNGHVASPLMSNPKPPPPEDQPGQGKGTTMYMTTFNSTSMTEN